MATIARGTVPAEELALHHTLETLPDVEIECERIVLSGDDAVMPLLWIRDADREEIDAALEEDPSVETEDCLSEFDDDYLYQMKWIDQVHLLLHMLTNAEASILDAYGHKDRWELRVLYPNRDHLSQTHSFAQEHGLTFDIVSFREMEGEPAGRYGLTDGQYHSLVTAAKRGYYEIPRKSGIEELADELEVSHQALSEQLRRGTGALIEDTLLIGESSK
jgi:predicted DNA binding protein